ncbi:hypothetical protein ACIP9H_15020 [Streptomyces sp. NPDC088732]|uniref:hypothetical protein n=1 Tax=Streptomyces sp. NPDC088732 TaxID=3365879 RepID=UPI0037F7187E
MNVAKLVLEYAKVFVWPAFLAWLAWRFRINVANLLDRLKSAETFAGTFNFEDQASKLDQQRQMAQAQDGVATEPAPLSLPGASDPRALVSVSPEAGVLLAYRAVELTARHAVATAPVDSRRGRPKDLASMLKLLIPQGLSENVYMMCRQLQYMRAEINHEGVSVSRGAAEDFVAACEFVTSKILELAPSAADWAAGAPSKSRLDRELDSISTEGL